jgi:arylsulfatase A-like enzyme/Flp pilus assembly protein TadD
MEKIRFRSFLLFLPVFLCAAFMVPFLFSLRSEEPNQNLLLITIDTLRADRLSCYGSENLKTPNVDSLAERGVLFSRAFANTSTTLPSHSNILLGTTPLHHGVHENLNFIVNEQLLTLAEHLKNNGYSTGAFVGAYALDSRFGLSQGFDIYDDNYSRVHSVNLSSLERNAEAVIEAAIEWLEGRISPWFLWVHCWDPHTPYDPPEPFKTQYRDHLYEGEVAYVDFILGKLFNYMKERNLFDNTSVVFTGDHGESLGQHGEKTHGFFAYNSGIWIPLIISSPGKKPGRVDHYVSHIDIFPTVCDVLELEKPSFLQGISLLPALNGKTLPERPIYIESLFPYYSRGWAPIRGFIHQKKKFIGSPIPELYELDKDFDELRNLTAGKKLDRYKKQLEKIISDQTPSEEITAKQKVDRETREKLRSLGYISSIQVTKKENFGAQDDVKVLLPLLNKTDKAWDLYKEGKGDEGIKLLTEIIEERKDVDIAYKRLAAIYEETGRTEEALKILEQGLDTIPSSYEIFQDYVKMLVSAGQYDKVISIFGKMKLREVEFDPVAWNNLGIAYAKKGNFKDAIKAYEVGLSLDSKYSELLNNMGNAYFSLGLQTKDSYVFQNCLEYYKKAIEVDPQYPVPYYGLGHAYREAGNMEGAIYCWGKALEADPNFNQAHMDLAIAYLNTGNKAKACELLNEYKRKYYHLMTAADRARFDDIMKNCQK